MRKGNPAAALAIIASIFGAAGVIWLLPGAVREEARPSPVLASRAVAGMSGIAPTAVAHPVAVQRVPALTRVVSTVEERPTITDVHVADAVMVDMPFSHDPGAPPALAATQLSFISAPAAPIAAEPVTHERRLGAVPAAFDRTGSALGLAFRKTGAGVKTAFSVLTP
jgi:hypothetical protein